MMKLSDNRRRKFTREFKLAAIERGSATGQSVGRCAEELGIPRNTLYRWISEYNAAPKDAFRGNGKRTEEQMRIRELERANAQLIRERDRLRGQLNGDAKTEASNDVVVFSVREERSAVYSD